MFLLIFPIASTGITRPKTSKKFETMHYLSPTKSSLAIAPEEVHLHPAFRNHPLRRLQKNKPWAISMKNMKTVVTQGKVIRARSKKRLRVKRRLSMKDLR